MPDGNFRDEENAVLVSVFEDLLVLGVMNGAGECGVENFQIVVIMLDGAGGFGEAFPGRLFVAGHPGEADLLAVDVEMAIVNFDFAIAEGVLIFVEKMIGGVGDGGANGVEIGVVEIPELKFVDCEGEFDRLLSASG